MGQWSLTSASEYFKTKYLKMSENAYNSATPLLSRVKKTYDFTGEYATRPVPTTYAGGVGSGRIPVASNDKAAKPIMYAKKVYAVAEIEREAIKAADGKDGSFVNQTKHSVSKAVESYNRNVERILFNTLDNGMLGAGDGSTTVTGTGVDGDPYVVKMSATGWKEANWEEQDGVNVGSETTLLTISEVVPSTRVVKFIGTSATLAAASGGTTFTSAKFYMQNSKDKDPTSIATSLQATTGTLYGQAVKRRWQAPVQAASGGVGITVDLMNDDMLKIHKACGQSANLIMTSYTQYRKILNLLEDKKNYYIEPRAANLKGVVSFKAIAFDSVTGEVPITFSRFIEDDRIYYLNDSFIELIHRPDFGWFDDDGTVFLRKSDDDAYEARYGGYWENYTAPSFHGYRDGLAA